MNFQSPSLVSLVVQRLVVTMAECVISVAAVSVLQTVIGPASAVE